MNFSRAIDFLTYLDDLAEQDLTPAERLIVLGDYTKVHPVVTGDVYTNGGNRGIAKWLRMWGQTPSVFMYAYCGGYDSFLDYKHRLRSGMLSKDIPDAMDKLIAETFRDMPVQPYGDHQHAAKDSMYREAEYE
jgi:hypothetical protein